MMAKNIYVPFVIQVMVGSKTPHLSKLAIKNPRITFSELNCTVYIFFIDALSMEKLYKTIFLD